MGNLRRVKKRLTELDIYDQLDNLDRMVERTLPLMQQAGCGYPIQKLHKQGHSVRVTIPPQVCASLNLEPGDYVWFENTRRPGLAVIANARNVRGLLMGAIDGCGGEPATRKVTRYSHSLRVTVPCQICWALSVDAGDSLIFGPKPWPGVISISAIKGDVR